jgi:hypothetical protein
MQPIIVIAYHGFLSIDIGGAPPTEWQVNDHVQDNGQRLIWGKPSLGIRRESG